MYKNKKGIIKKLKLFFLFLINGLVGFNSSLSAQTFEKVYTINIGYPVTSLEFLTNFDSTQTFTPLAIGVKNINYGTNRLSAGWVDIRNPNNGELISHYNLNNFVNDLDYYESNDDKFLAAATDRSAALINVTNGKITKVNSPFYNVVNTVSFSDDGNFITGDSDGGIILFDKNETNGLLPVKKIIQNPEHYGSGIFSLSNYSEKLIAGSNNHIDVFNDSTWEKAYTINTPPTQNDIGRANLVVDISNSFASADVDSLSLFNIINGQQLGRVEMKDRPSSIAFGAYNIALIAVGTSYDNTYVYELKNSSSLTLIGNFTNHTGTVTSVAFGSIIRSNDSDIYGMATASSDGTVEIWKLIEN